ncbi:ImmA/IrrE family metallo-endopeptidase [Parafrankia sp. FMc2]|uniref:ImmA/IrrE family metallo-endopeptidase n=1 Tax=Parafrankia sp. FMc2 TaxID=3233196 RepID=UPI0034D45B7A
MTTAARKTTARKGTRRARPTLTPEERAERIETARAQLAAGVESLLTSEGWKRLIESRQWLRRYSAGNQLMILMQRPDATDVRSLRDWNTAECLIRKGEAGIRIWAPAGRRGAGAAKAEGEQVAPETPEAAPPGTPVRSGPRFILVSVFDRSQLVEPPTVDEALETPELLRGDAPAGLWDGLAKQVAAAGYALERGDCGTANGHTDPVERVVRVREDVDPAQAAKTLAHELAHVLLEHTAAMPGHVREVEAESVACVVASVVGLDSGAYSVPYVAGWAGDVAAVKASAEKVLATADQILTALGVPRPGHGDSGDES